MSDPKEIEEIEGLEARLLAANISINQLVRRYAGFLLQLIHDGSLSSISTEKLNLMSSYLNKAVTPGTLESSHEQRSAFFVELWPIERQYRESDPAFANFVRCVICCFGNEEDWLRDDTGDDTPLWFFLFYIKKVCPDIKDKFVKFFEETC
ncbi:hypothetical protein [Pseudomonas sp. MWU16-30322]|uniref:hypothetical protein n=1 Tax=Pseudomonas sp. MWU16-30322 TaxID=2878092 RepID=UPI001CFC3992|nr:hypothetical protein [Pseudomonas sp. MWU16-30322]